MPITVTCAACGQSYPIRDDMAGKRVRCRCGLAIEVPEGGSFYNFLDELPPQAPPRASPVHSPRQAQPQRLAPSRRKPSAKSAWLIPAIAISAVVVPCVLVVGCVVLVAGSRRTAEPVASGWNDLGSESFVASGPPSSAEAELQRIRSAGEPISFADLDAYYPAPPADQDVTQLWLTGIAPLDSPQFKASANGLSFVSDGPERIPWPGETWEQLAAAEKLLTSYRTSLDAIHQAARRGGRARFPIRFTDGANMPLPHADRLRAATRLLALEAAVAAHRGQTDAAVDAVMAMFAAARSIEQEPILVMQLMRMAIGASARGRVEWLLSAAALDDAQLARLDAELAASSYGEPMRRALVGERVIGTEGFSNLALVLPLTPQELSRMPRSTKDKPTYLQLMRETIAAFEKDGPARKQAAAAADARVIELTRTWNAKRTYPITLSIMPPVIACAEAANRNDGERDAARAAVAVERFFRSEGRLPSKLNELVPRFLGSPPIDPCDGQPLRYRVEAAEYLVYSVGPNGVDDGGRLAPTGKEGDAVIRVRRK